MARTAVTVALLSSPAWAAVSGRVLDPDGQPVAAVAVTAFAPETTEERMLRVVAGGQRTALGSTRTAADGTFRVEAAASVLVLEARADGFAPSSERSIAGAPVTFGLIRAASVRGLVTAAGRAVAGARVVWTREDAEWTAVTAADGTYQVPKPEEWSGHVVVVHADYALDEGFGTAGARNAADRKLEPGVPIEGVVRDERGRPAPAARLWGGQWTAWPLATARPDGSFRIAHAQPGWRFVQARAGALVGTAQRTAGRLAIVLRPARSVTGMVRDTAGRPLAGATVGINGRAGSATAIADAAGRYRLDGLSSGSYSAMAARPGYTAARGLQTQEVDLRAALQAQQDFVLEELPVVRGRVQDEAQRPVDGALVFLGFKGTPHLYAAQPFAQLDVGGDVTRTAADGTFTLTRSTAPREQVDMLKDRPLIVMKRGFAPARVTLPEPGNARAPALVVTLPRGLELAGRVVSPEGTPLKDVQVTLAEDGTFGGTMMPVHMILAALKPDHAWTLTGEDGRFQVRVHPGVHHLSFRAKGRAPRLVRGHDPRGGEPLQVVLDPAASVRGHVLRADGRGVAGVEVSLEQPLLMEAPSATTGDDGAFELTDLAAGPYELKAEKAEMGLQLRRAVEAPADDVQVVLDPAGALRVRVVDAPTRRPLPSYHLTLTLPDGRGARAEDVQDAAGTFTAEDVPPGDVTVNVTADGHAARDADGVAVSAGATATVELALDPEALVRGRVTGEGKPVPDAQVRATAREGGYGATAGTGEDGEFELRGLAAGEWTLAVRAAGFLPEKRTVDTTQASRVDVALRRGLTLTGTVTRDGAPVAGAHVGAQSSAAHAGSAAARTDERGAFRLEGLAAGRYTVTAAAGDGAGRAEAKDVDAETASPLRLVLTRGRTGVITGKVVGLPAEEGMVAMVGAAGDEPGASANAMVDGSMAFRMEDAPSGHVTLRAQAMSLATSAQRTSRKVELTLAPGAEAEVVLEFGADAVTGVVTRAGAPVPGVSVTFGSAAGNGTAQTDARGAYQVFGLEPGRYSVSVSGDGDTFTTEYLANGAGEFDIDITGGALRGRAVRADGGQPVRGVEVSLWWLGGGENRPRATEQSNERGEFAFRSLREGRYRLITSKAGFGQELREVEVERAATTPVQVELSPADGITVSVVDARDNRPLEAVVVVRDTARRVVANRHSGVEEDGTINIPLADGAYLLSTSADDYGTATLPVRSPSQGLRVGLTAGGTLVIESGRDLRGRVRLIRPDGDEYVQCWCNGIADIQLAGRRTSVEHVTAGSYTLELLDGEEVVARKPVAIQDSQTTTVTID